MAAEVAAARGARLRRCACGCSCAAGGARSLQRRAAPPGAAPPWTALRPTNSMGACLELAEAWAARLATVAAGAGPLARCAAIAKNVQIAGTQCNAHSAPLAWAISILRAPPKPPTLAETPTRTTPTALAVL